MAGAIDPAELGLPQRAIVSGDYMRRPCLLRVDCLTVRQHPQYWATAQIEKDARHARARVSRQAKPLLQMQEAGV
ncbi:hypothetical protein LTR09_003968 [Extremus antarcticus]|uniref:Uncharacterized protein n=1 Tax=Extremus antarcticus TaxID=702011 RepID=A0AAJ0GD28_9PEZI|nr:hypothetical protein LTR09_003968 [Extremus antarcticus]